MKKSTLLTVICSAVLVLGLSIGALAAPSDKAIYVGDGACSACHNPVHTAWSNTTHGQFVKDLSKDPKAFGGDLSGKNPKMVNFTADDLQFALLGKPGLLKVQELVGKKGAFGVPADDYPVLWASWNFGSKEWEIETEGIGEGTPWLSTCAGCHVTDLKVPTQKNPNVARSFSGPGITCEQCHGPASEHIAGPSRSNIVVSLSAENCGQCHTRGGSVALNPKGKPFGYPYSDKGQYRPGAVLADYYTSSTAQNAPKDWWPTGNARNSHHMQYPEWLASSHARALDGLKNSGHASDSCLSCHSAEANLAKDGKVKMADAKEGVTCQVCHASHGPDGRLGLLRQSREETCTVCHTAEKVVVGRTPHHTQKELTLGTGGVGVANAGPSEMYRAGVTCVDCHMPKTMGEKRSHLMRVVLPSEGKKYDMPDSCGSCHPGASQDYLQARLDKWQGDVKAQLAGTKARVDRLAAKYAKNKTYLEARLNYEIVAMDKSNGVHNYDYAMALLTAANKKLDTLK